MAKLFLIISLLLSFGVYGQSDQINYKIVDRDSLQLIKDKLLSNPGIEFRMATFEYIDATNFDLMCILGSIQKRIVPTNNKKVYYYFWTRYSDNISISSRLSEVYVSYYTDYETRLWPSLVVTILYGEHFKPNFENEIDFSN